MFGLAYPPVVYLPVYQPMVRPFTSYMHQPVFVAANDPKFFTHTFILYSVKQHQDVARYTLLASDGSFYLGQKQCRAEQLKFMSQLQLTQDIYEELPKEKFFPLLNTETIKVFTGPVESSYFKRQNVTISETYSPCYLKFLMRELLSVEEVAKNPHPNICEYRGAVVNEISGRVVGLAYKGYTIDLWKFAGSKRLVAQTQIDKIVEGVAAGLKHLHAHGLVHCDVHPGNIFLTVVPGPGMGAVETIEEVVLGDFDACRKAGERIRGKLAAPAWIGHAWVSGSKAVFDIDLCALESVKRWLGSKMVQKKKA